MSDCLGCISCAHFLLRVYITNLQTCGRSLFLFSMLQPISLHLRCGGNHYVPMACSQSWRKKSKDEIPRHNYTLLHRCVDCNVFDRNDIFSICIQHPMLVVCELIFTEYLLLNIAFLNHCRIRPQNRVIVPAANTLFPYYWHFFFFLVPFMFFVFLSKNSSEKTGNRNSHNPFPITRLPIKIRLIFCSQSEFAYF